VSMCVECTCDCVCALVCANECVHANCGIEGLVAWHLFCTVPTLFTSLLFTHCVAPPLFLHLFLPTLLSSNPWGHTLPHTQTESLPPDTLTLCGIGLKNTPSPCQVGLFQLYKKACILMLTIVNQITAPCLLHETCCLLHETCMRDLPVVRDMLPVAWDLHERLACCKRLACCMRHVACCKRLACCKRFAYCKRLACCMRHVACCMRLAWETCLLHEICCLLHETCMRDLPVARDLHETCLLHETSRLPTASIPYYLHSDLILNHNHHKYNTGLFGQKSKFANLHAF